jgi:multidrug resistance efflux pump
MIAGLLITAIAGLIFWLVFFKFKWIKLTYAWGLIVVFFFLHLTLIFLIGLRFVAPYTTTATVIQHTIQLVPRLPEPTLVTAVLVKPDVPVKKGQPLFQFDRRPYEYKVQANRSAAGAGQAERPSDESRYRGGGAKGREAQERARVRQVCAEAFGRSRPAGRRPRRRRQEAGRK